ncbi:hypothetical protein H5S09_03835 [Limosilactobacillus sp. STM2_1]|uniref:Uncharacterized protein n=1 Tax=Limosilactobacillus rudii TaxID=2759755 RepID=A0A7W3YMH5_9LACO|nr:hypothetical protein [Limosilactobacillus rudii]MBB1079191.1 hypothetical protein [Limosilactobacillus rudii]MBB1097083.1 hypothetical protein [Limosilactobacillus rudii]MCD7134338.1 hypothetical protein [Limosilactobacillus rudii]
MTVFKDPKYFMVIYFREEDDEYTGGYGIVEAGKSIVYPIIDFENCSILCYKSYGSFKVAEERMYVPTYSDIRFVKYSRFADIAQAHPELNNDNVCKCIRWRFEDLGIKMLTKEREKRIKQIVEYDPSAGERLDFLTKNVETYFKKLRRKHRKLRKDK